MNLPDLTSLTTGDGFYVNSSGASKAVDYDVLKSQVLSGTSGTFTPTIGGSSTFGTQTYNIQAGAYIRLGDLINFWGRVWISAKGGGIAGNIVVAGLPFTASNITNLNHFPVTVVCSVMTLSAGFSQFTAMIDASGSTFTLIQTGSGVGSTAVPVANLGTPSEVWFSGAYRTN